MNESILEEARRLVHGDRGESYGHPVDDFSRTGRIWGAILGIPDVTAEQVALCMAAVKISREVNQPKRDNRVDIAGYAETLDMVVARRGGQEAPKPRGLGVRRARMFTPGEAEGSPAPTWVEVCPDCGRTDLDPAPAADATCLSFHAGDYQLSGDEIDALIDVEPENRYREALEKIKTQQPKVLAYIALNGFKFATPLQKPDNERTEAERWEKLAFSIYSDLCEVDTIASFALDPDDEE